MAHHFPGCIKNSVIPPQITRVMVGAFDVKRIGDFNFSGENQFKQKGRIMLDRIVPSLGGIFVFQSIIGMGIRGQNMLKITTLQDLNVVLSERIKEPFFPHPAGIIACGFFTFHDNSEINTRRIKHLSHFPGGFDTILVEGCKVTDVP